MEDLEHGIESIPALLICIGAPRLQRLGMPVPDHKCDSPEERLYELLRLEDTDAAHSRYNALIRRLVSFERAAESQKLADSQRILEFIRALGLEAESPADLYLTGGATAVLLGWRATTIDVDIRFFPESDRLFQAIPSLKEKLGINVELASPADFIPEVPGWKQRSIFVEKAGKLSCYHYDPYAQALAKIERSHAQDVADVQEMMRRGLVDSKIALGYFREIEPRLYLYPAIDPASYRHAVQRMLL